MLTKPHPSAYNFCMAGKVRKNRENFYIDLHFRGERLKLYSDKEGVPYFSERHAARILERIRSEIDADEFNPKNYIKREIKALRLENYVVAWLGRQKLRLEAGEISHGYFAELRYAVHKHLIPHLGDRDIRHMNKGHLDDFLAKLKMSAKSKKNTLGVLRSVFTDAVDREEILRLPKFPKIEVGDPQIRWLDPEAQDAILEQFKDPVRKAFFTFLVHLGVRPGEARALKWEDFDWTHETVTIHAAMDRSHYRPSTKEKDVRTLPLPGEVIGPLKDIWPTSTRPLSGFVFTFRGAPFGKQAVYEWWTKAAKTVGYDISLYQGTKHSLGCRARLQGVPLDVIQDWFGHKSAASTRRYAKIQVESLKVMHRKEKVVELRKDERI